MQTITIY